MNLVNWRDSLYHVTQTAERESCSLTSLGEALAQLAFDLDSDRYSALAFIAETAAGSCATNSVDVASARFAVIDLCQRILVSLETSQPFDFTSADSTLMALLFPEERPVQATEQVSQGVSEQATRIEAVQTEVCQCADEQLIVEFLNEANEHLQNSELLMLSLESNPLDQDAINGLFRAVHSIKGSAGVLELQSLGVVSHLAESVLVLVRDGSLVLRDVAFEVILNAIDTIRVQVKSLADCHAAKRQLEYPAPSSILINCLQVLYSTGTCSKADLQTLKQGSRYCEAPVASETRKKSSLQSDTLRVDGKRLERLIDLIGELVITDAMVQRELRSRESLTATSVSTRLRKVVREVQQLSLTLKMVPIGTVLQKMHRLVRDLATKLGKQVDIQIVGADTEVDKTLLECIADPLVHLVRNSIDHGVEATVEERIAAGKPAVATIRITAEHRAGCIHLQISDDGRGLNRAKILTTAIERGLVSADKELTDAEIDQLLFTPGFSTASEVTEISGRGVGMDVVRKNIESMRGSISLRSQFGVGTEVNLELPLTLSIIDGTVIRIGDRSFIIPTLSVVEQVQHSSLEYSGNGECSMVLFRSRYLPVQRLGDVLGTAHAKTLKHGQVVMIIESGGKQFALIVDEVLGQQPIVIKPLGSVLAGATYFAGGALLSDGQIGFVLDLNAICNPGS